LVNQITTTACRITGETPSAISVIELSGPASSAWIDRHWTSAKSLSGLTMDAIRYGEFHCDQAVGESIIVCRTSENRYELHCHGGKLAAQSILNMMAAEGIVIETYENWCERNCDDPLIAQATMGLVKAKTIRTSRILLDQQKGASVRALKQIDAAILQGEMQLARRLADEIRIWNDLGLHLIEPFEILLCGPPNVGKSSLLNRLLGYQRAIVHEQAGTTRDMLAEETSIDGWPVRIQDSAGIRTAGDVIEKEGVRRAIHASRTADLQLILVDPAEGWTTEHQHLLDLNPSRSLIVETKSDVRLENKTCSNPRAEANIRPIRVSSVSGEGIPELLQAISKRLVPTIPPAGQAVLFTTRQQQSLEDRFSVRITSR
jgi:tRNA modification GTPase